MTSRVRGLLIAAICGLVLFARVYEEFPYTRWKVITNPAGQPAERGALTVDIPYAEILAKQTTPIVVIARLDNPSPNDVTINISWNGANIGRATVGRGGSRRIDLTLPPGSTLRGEDHLRFRGPDAPWKVTYLELANLHGAVRGAVSAVAVPAVISIAPVLPWPYVLAVVGVLILVAWFEGAPWAWKPARIAHAIVIGVLLTLFTVALLAPFVSPYKILISWRTFWIVTALMLTRGLWRGFAATRQTVGRRVLGSTAAFDSVIVALVVAAFFTAVMITRLNAAHKGNYSGFLQLQNALITTTPMLEGRDDLKQDLKLIDGGYDGMYMYLMAFDPFMSRFKDDPIRYEQVVDTPPYRYTRIGFSLLTKLFAWNQPERFPVTMVWLIIASHFLAALALGAIIRQHGGHPAWALLYIFIPGFLQSLTVALPESIAAAGFLTGIWLVLGSRFALASVCFAATLLVRETSAIVVVMLAAWLWSRRQWRGAFVVGLSIAPLIAWRGFVTWRLFEAYGWSSFFFSPGNLTLPFKGIADLWDAIGRGAYFLDFRPLVLAGRLFPCLLIAALIVSVILLWKRRDGLSAAAVAAALIAVSLDFPHVWTHVGNAERVTFDVFVLLLASFATLLGRGGAAPGQERMPDTFGLRVMVLGFFAATAVYTIYYSLESPTVRQILLYPQVLSLPQIR